MSRKEKPASEMTEAGVKSSSQEMIFIIQLPNLGLILHLLYHIENIIQAPINTC